MRLYKSDGKIFAELDETIELCEFGMSDTLQKYKEELIKKISSQFDWEVMRSALKGMEND